MFSQLILTTKELFPFLHMRKFRFGHINDSPRAHGLRAGGTCDTVLSSPWIVSLLRPFAIVFFL